MHALGFYHEQSRPDRDDHVTINFENIQSGREGNFQKSSNVNSLGSPYDYGSILHYGAYAFSSNGQPTIDANGNSIGQRNGASPTDVVQLRLLYQCAKKINDMKSYIANPCTEDCKCSIGMTGCAGNDDSCHGSSTCVDNTCSVGFCLAEGLSGCDVDPCCAGLECQRAGRGKRRTYTCISGSTCKTNGLSCGSGSECCSGKCKGGKNPKCKL